MGKIILKEVFSTIEYCSGTYSWDGGDDNEFIDNSADFTLTLSIDEQGQRWPEDITWIDDIPEDIREKAEEEIKEEIK